MYKRKKIYRRNILLIITLIVILFTALILYIMNTKRHLNPVEKVIKDTVLSVGNIIYKPIDFISDKIKESNEKKKIYDKYKALEEKYNAIKDYEETIDNLEKEKEDLQKMLDLNNTLLDYDKINVSVISRDIGLWYDTFIINKGTSSGITDNMAVISSDGLIGKVVASSNFYSTVMLLTSPNFDQKISVRIKNDEGKYIFGILSSYDQKSGCFIVDGIAENVVISEGNTVKTTGLSDIFPNGVIVGKVESVKKDNFDLSTIVYVKPSSNFDDLNYVAVLKRKEVIND